MSAIEQILDPNNCDPIVMYNENNEEVAFEQIAIVPIEGEAYVILKPVNPMEGVGEDEALVFAIVVEDGEEMLVVEDRTEIIDEVFRQYYEMLEQQ
jgi:hypothetical protein